MNLKSFNNVKFIKSITKVADKPDPDLPEIVFIGRSNVGKSSLLNALFNRKKLAHISRAPGKTRLINYYLMDDKVYFVDLPGYGYAKISKKIRHTWAAMIESYLLGNDQLRIICLLIDARHEMQPLDMDMITWLHENNLPFIVIVTKADKLPKNRFLNMLHYYQNKFPDHHILPFSIKGDEYRIGLRKFLLNHLINKD